MSQRHQLRRTQVVSAPIEQVTAFFENPGNLESLTPAFLNFRIETEGKIQMKVGAIIEYRIGLHGIPIRWRTEIVQYNPGVDFVDFQVRGPFKYWHHLHSFRPTSSGTEMTDLVSFELPLGALGALAYSVFVRGQLKRIFDHRAVVVQKLFANA